MVNIANIFLEKGPPGSYQELMEYPGVGVKIATLYFNHAEGANQGVGVDTHVHRISNRLGWCHTNKPEDTEKSLSTLFPSEAWPVINHALVGFGQTTCNAKKPLCGGCPVRDRCDFYEHETKWYAYCLCHSIKSVILLNSCQGILRSIFVMIELICWRVNATMSSEFIKYGRTRRTFMASVKTPRLVMRLFAE